ncbi:MAG: hypothetical protein ACHQWU_02450 [Gemmatimonadales bacterium]
MSGINWSVELRKIEREYDGLPPARSRTQIRLQKVQEILARGRLEERLAALGVWVRLALIAALTAGLHWWPYGHDCGFSLAAYLASQAMVIAGGLSLAISTWRNQLVRPFAGAVVFCLIAWTVIAIQVFPRMGFGATPRVSIGWVCRAGR